MTAPFRTVVAWFLAIDIAFILIHGIGFVLNMLGMTGPVPMPFMIAKDGGLPEDFNYIKWAIIIIALLRVALRDRWWTPLAWSFVFLLILLDDSLQLHESFGAFLADTVSLPTVDLLQSSDLGELLAFGLMGSAVVLLIAPTFLRSGPESRGMSMFYIAIVLALGLFGVLVDALHQAAALFAETHPSVHLLPHMFALVEDGGEMIVASFAVAATLVPPDWAQVMRQFRHNR